MYRRSSVALRQSSKAARAHRARPDQNIKSLYRSTHCWANDCNYFDVLRRTDVPLAL